MCYALVLSYYRIHMPCPGVFWPYLAEFSKVKPVAAYKDSARLPPILTCTLAFVVIK